MLEEAQALSDGSGVLFPSARGGPLSEVAISNLVRDLKIGAVPHGFRSSFRDWAAECSDAPREVCELALAHVNTNSHAWIVVSVSHAPFVAVVVLVGFLLRGFVFGPPHRVQQHPAAPAVEVRQDEPAVRPYPRERTRWPTPERHCPR